MVVVVSRHHDWRRQQMVEEWRPQLVETNPQKEEVQLGYEMKDSRQVLMKNTQA